jgi:glycerol dehydrogenase
MNRSLVAPARYLQGPNILADESSYGSLPGSTAFILGGDTALKSTESSLTNGLKEAGIDPRAVKDGVDACTYSAIDSLADQVVANEADTVIGVGGGVALDTSKAVAEKTGTELVIVPTIASTDAPCSAIAVVYDDDGSFEGFSHRARNPELVLADTKVIANAPTRFLRHGMGDAFATHFEAKTAADSYTTAVAGAKPSFGALLLAEHCYTQLRDYGEAAIAAAQNNAVTPALERIVETNTVFSGIGFESGGLAAAHAFHKGFSSEKIGAPHGLIVGFGTIAQLVLEGDSTNLETAIDLATTLEIAPPLKELGVTTEIQIENIAERACQNDTTMRGEPMDVTPSMAADALRTADELLRDESP